MQYWSWDKQSNKVAYKRRLGVLGALKDMENAKRQLKYHQEDIDKEEKLLFAEEFQKHVKTVTQAQESAEKPFTKQNNSWASKRKTPSSARQPFYSGSSYNNNARQNGN